MRHRSLSVQRLGAAFTAVGVLAVVDAATLTDAAPDLIDAAERWERSVADVGMAVDQALAHP